MDAPESAQPLVVVDHVEREVDDGGGEAVAVLLAHVAVVQMQTARAEDLGGEVELPPPVVDEGVAEEALRPLVHLGGDTFGDAQEDRVTGDRKLEIALVIERHGVDLPEGILAIEHPAIGAGEERVGGVAKAALQARPRLGGGPGALNPLALQIGRDLTALEVAIAGVLNPDVGARDQRLGVQESDTLAGVRSRLPPRNALGHEFAPVTVERRQDFQSLTGRRCVNLGVCLQDAAAVFEFPVHLFVLPTFTRLRIPGTARPTRAKVLLFSDTEWNTSKPDAISARFPKWPANEIDPRGGHR